MVGFMNRDEIRKGERQLERQLGEHEADKLENQEAQNKCTRCAGTFDERTKQTHDAATQDGQPLHEQRRSGEFDEEQLRNGVSRVSARSR